MVLALLSGRSAADVLDIQRAAHLRTMRELTTRKREGDLADQLICDHALFHLEADLRWLELTAARLDELRKQVIGDEHGGSRLAGGQGLRKAFGPTNALEDASLTWRRARSSP